VILGSLTGITVSGLEIPLPQILQRTLDMLSGLAPPMALLLIGASISFKAMKKYLGPVMISVLIKLLILPALGLALYTSLHLPAADYLPGLILLCCPTATIAYIMAREMGGDADFVVAAISTSTLLSAGSFLFWLGLVIR
jgi:predicted permease